MLLEDSHTQATRIRKGHIEMTKQSSFLYADFSAFWISLLTMTTCKAAYILCAVFVAESNLNKQIFETSFNRSILKHQNIFFALEVLLFSHPVPQRSIN